MTDPDGAEHRAEVSCSVDVPTSADRLFAAATDWDRHQRWMLATHVTADSPSGVGTTLNALTGIGRVGMPDTMRIEAWDPPRLCRVAHTGAVVRGTASFAVTGTPTGSRFTWTESLVLPLGRLGRLGWPLVRPLAVLGLRLSLARLARWAPTWEPAATAADGAADPDSADRTDGADR